MAQSVQVVSPSLLLLPLGQGSQTPPSVDMLPSVQLVQGPPAVVSVPAAQVVQVAEPSASVVWPGGHGEHAVSPAAELKPISQGTQLSAPALVPATHTATEGTTVSCEHCASLLCFFFHHMHRHAVVIECSCVHDVLACSTGRRSAIPMPLL